MFRLLIVLQLFNSLISSSQHPSLQKTLSSVLCSPSHVGSFSSQCLAEQPGLISPPARNNSQHLSNTTLICLSSVNIFLLLATENCLLPVLYQSLYQSCKGPGSLTVSIAGTVILVWLLPRILSLQISPSLLLRKSLPSHTPSLSSPPSSAPQAFLHEQPHAAPLPHPHCAWASSCPCFSRVTSLPLPAPHPSSAEPGTGRDIIYALRTIGTPVPASAPWFYL